MADGRRHYQHALRVLALFAGGFALFIAVRYALIPADFDAPGYGFYRAGALTDVMAQTPLHAGEATCLDCHSDVGDVKKASPHAKVHCEACHGPLGKHAAGDVEAAKKIALNPRTLCERCHKTKQGLPAGFPNVVPSDHAGDLVCTDCHQPHSPKIG
jgi:hypothetical protein